MKNIKGTDFQKMVWSEITKIPKGKTITYKELAMKIGKPKAYRAVGNACAKNPLIIEIPFDNDNLTSSLISSGSNPPAEATPIIQ